MMRRIGLVLAVVAGFGSVTAAVAQGTKLWSVGRYDEMERGSRDGVAIRSDGRLEPGPATSLLYTAPGSFVWGLAADGAGDAFVGVGGSTAGSAAVMRVGADGKATKIFTGKELAVQAVRLGTGGDVVFATNPEGKVYRVAAGGGAAAVVFDPALTAEKPKYLWDVAVGLDGAVYVATGAPAAVYRVAGSGIGAGGGGGGRAELLFRTADQHIRCLLLGADGTLWAGSDGAGVVYRFETRRPGAKPFAAYAAARKEITALAMDGAGNVYAAGVGAKGSGGAGLPPLPVTGNVGVTLTFVQPGSAAAAGTNALLPEGSEVYRIGVDGAPLRMVTLKDDVVYGLAVRDGALLAATGNRGVVYRLDLGVPGRFADLVRLEAAQGMVFASGKEGLLVGTSNSGKVFRVGDGAAREATYTSDVFDAQGFARWGRVEVQYDAMGGTAVPKFDLLLRSGNVPSPVQGWSEWVRATPNAGAAGAPAGRYVQWRVVLRPGAAVSGVGVNYLPKNIAPAVDEVVVATGARVAQASGGAGGQNATVQIAFPTAAGAGGSSAINFVQDGNASPLTAQRDRTAVTVRWAAHDDNGDDLMFAVWYRGAGERNWRLLKDKISERYLSFDSSLLPDGTYTVKVVASDAPVHTDADALTGEGESAGFTVDTTPPVPGALVARMEAGAGAGPRIRATFEARDQTSPIAHAEYSVDAGPWQYMEPVGGLSDSLLERYDFVAELPARTGAGQAGVLSPTEHVLAVRVYDRFENVVSVKTVVR